MIGLEIVSDENENGMALYKTLGGAGGHGGRTYCNLIGLNLGVFIHELGHAIEQEVRLTTESDILTRWKSEAKDVDEWDVSPYGNQNAWEDMAEFCKVYSVALQNDTRKELETLSPNRYKIWTHCLELVNNSLRVPRCETPVAPEPIIVDDPNEEEDKPVGGRGGGRGGDKPGGKKPQEDPPDNYEPDTAEDTAPDEFDYYPLLVVFSLIGAATGAYFVSRPLKSSPRK